MLTSLLLPLVGCGTATPPAPDTLPDASASPKNVTVDCGGGGDFETMQEAISDAVEGDTIDVEPCTYEEQIDFQGKTLTLVGLGSSRGDTVIDGGGTGPVVMVRGGEGSGTGLQNMTITGGDEEFGAAVYVDFSNFRLEDVDVEGNTGSAILYAHSSGIELVDVRFRDNTVAAVTDAAAVWNYRGALMANQVEVSCDGGPYGIYLEHSSGIIDGSDLSCPDGLPAYYFHATGRLQRSWADGLISNINEEPHTEDLFILENNVLDSGLGVYSQYGILHARNNVIIGTLTVLGTENPIIESNILVDGACGIEIDSHSTVGSSIAYNDFWNVAEEGCGGVVYSGTDGNIADDPEFTDRGADDYTLAAGSPCIDAGTTDADYEDTDGTRNDMGAYGGPKNLAEGS